MKSLRNEVKALLKEVKKLIAASEQHQKKSVELKLQLDKEICHAVQLKYRIASRNPKGKGNRFQVPPPLW